MDNKINIAVIPAREGSKRFPGKNRAVIKGKSLVEHAILCAHDSKIFDQIILSTDDKYFSDLSERYPYLTIRHRPKSISQDESTPFDVLMDLYKHNTYEQAIRFCYLQPTSPLRLKSDLINSISDNSISVYYDEDNRLNNSHNVIEVLKTFDLHKRLQNSMNDLQNFYFNGLFYWIDIETLKAQRGFLGAETIFIETPIERSNDIDYEKEFKQAELQFMKTLGFEDVR